MDDGEDEWSSPSESKYSSTMAESETQPSSALTLKYDNDFNIVPADRCSEIRVVRKIASTKRALGKIHSYIDKILKTIDEKNSIIESIQREVHELESKITILSEEENILNQKNEESKIIDEEIIRREKMIAFLVKENKSLKNRKKK